jgi:hypothetical protein
MMCLTRSEIKLLLTALEKYAEKRVFGSPVEEETYEKAKRQLTVALLDFNFD